MNRPIRQLAHFIIIIFLVLAAATTYFQFFAAQKLNANQWNVRTLYHQYGTERGPIIVDGQAIAHSVPSDDEYAYARVYENSPLYSNITGYFSVAHNSVTGVEHEMNSVLSGADTSLAFQRITSMFSGSQPRGGGVELTIDSTMQEAAQRALQGRKGAVVALNSETGAIAAQYTTPGFDANAIASHDVAGAHETYNQLEASADKPLLDRTTGDAFAPGSVFKIVTAAAMIENLGITPDSEVEAPLNYTPAGTTHQIWNFRRVPCGGKTEGVTLSLAFEQSCNTPFVVGAEKIGAEKLIATAEKFGINDTFKTPLPVVASTFPQPQDAAALAMDSFGQKDVRTTPMQMAMIAAAVANKGVVMKPYLIKQTLSADLEPVRVTTPQQYQRAISEETAAYLQQMMLKTVEQGLGTPAAIPGIEIGGKTGTAEEGSGENLVGWFVANAKIGEEKYSVAVAIEGSNGASVLAAPIAKQIIEAKVNKAPVQGGR